MSTINEMVNDNKPNSKQLQKIVKTLKKKKEIDEEKARIEERLRQLNLRDQELNQELHLYAQVSIEYDENNTSDDERGNQFIDNNRLPTEASQTLTYESEEEERPHQTRNVRIKDEPSTVEIDEIRMSSSRSSNVKHPTERGRRRISNFKIEEIDRVETCQPNETRSEWFKKSQTSPVALSSSSKVENVPQEARRPNPTRNMKFKEEKWTIEINQSPAWSSSSSNVTKRTKIKPDEIVQQNVKSEYLDWRDGTFSWIKFTKRSKYLPAIILPTDDEIEIARSITLKGTLSIHSFIFFKACTEIDERLKDKRYKKALRKFYDENYSFFD